jgi:hypothetical protein
VRLTAHVTYSGIRSATLPMWANWRSADYNTRYSSRCSAIIIKYCIITDVYLHPSLVQDADITIHMTLTGRLQLSHLGVLVQDASVLHINENSDIPLF